MHDGFGERWRRNPRPQSTSESDFWDKTGWGPGDLEGAVVLDAGCGCGRFSVIAGRYAGHVVGIDLSEHAVRAAQENVPENVSIRQDDLLDIRTVPDESVDFAFAIGTLHHTGDTRRAFFEVARKVRVGGELAVWLYERPSSDELTLRAIHMLHEITREVPPDRLYEVMARHAPALRDLYAEAYKNSDNSTAALRQVLRISNLEDDDECISDTFDWHAPSHRDWVDLGRLQAWFQFEGFEVNWVGDFPETARGRKAVRKHRERLHTATSRAAGQDRPRVLLVSDVRGWAFDQNMKDLEEYLGGKFQLEHGYSRDWISEGVPAPDFREYDTVYVLYHRYGIEPWIPRDRIVGSLRSASLFPESSDPVGEAEKNLLDQYAAFHVTNKDSYRELVQIRPDILYLPNPVNMNRFPERTEPPPRPLVASWSGNARHTNPRGDDVKGFYSIIVPACRNAGITLEFAEYNTCRLDPSEMPSFYSRGDIALCASLYEGCSNSTLEAMASGQALITTDCGNHRELQEAQLDDFGESGIIIVERSVVAFVKAIRELHRDPARVHRMGRLNRAEISKRWSWDVWADRYADFLSSTATAGGLARGDNK